MDQVEVPTSSAAESEEFDRALERFRSLLNPDEIDAMQPMGPAAVYTALVTVWLLVYQRLHAECPLSDAVTDLLASDPQALPANRRLREGTLSANTSAYSRARKRLKPEITERLASRVFDSLVADLPTSLGDRRSFNLDGTTIALAPTPGLKAAFPPAVNQHGTSVWPVAHLLVAHELESGCAILPELGPMYGDRAMSESELTTALLPRLPARSVLLGDRNFGIFAVAHAAVQAGHDVVLRLTKSRFGALLRRATSLGSREGHRSWSLIWRPSVSDRKAHPELPTDTCIRVRLHEVVVSESLTLWLVTTLSDDAAVLAKLYRRRHDVETDIRDLKVTLKTEEIRVKGEEMLRKELAASIIAYNLVVQVRRLAAKDSGVAPRRLSFRGVLGAVQIVLLKRGLMTALQWREKFALTLRIAGQRKIPDRPDRRYPRQALARRNKSTNGEKHSIPKPK